jgi:hypothetical protein
MADELTLEQQLTALRERLNLSTDLGEMTEEQMKREIELLSLREKRVEQIQKELEALEKLNDLTKNQYTGLGDVVGLAEKRGELAQALLRAKKEANNLTDDEILKLRDRNAEVDAYVAGIAEAPEIMKKMLGITGKSSNLIGKMASNSEFLTTGIRDAALEMLSFRNISISLFDKVFEATSALVVAQDDMLVSFAKTTGNATDFNETLLELEANNYQYGVTAAESAESVGALFKNVNDFTELGPSQKKLLSENVAILGELGVAAETSSKNIQFATKVLGMSLDGAARLQRDFVGFAQELGVPVAQMSEDFAKMGPLVAALGDNGVKAFKSLEVQAKNTGLEVSEILSLVEKFDKFDSAAESVGKLNAILGGPYLNSLELVAETDPSERFKILKERIDAAGISFDEMSYYERKAAAAAAGLNEQQLALMMRGRLDLIAEPTKSAAELEKLAEQTKDFNKIMDEMIQLGRMFATDFIGPLIPGLKMLLQGIQKLAPYMKMFSPMILLTGALAAGFMFLLGIVAKFSTVLTALRVQTIANTVATGANTSAIELNALAEATRTLANDTAAASQALLNGTLVTGTGAMGGFTAAMTAALPVLASIAGIALGVGATFVGVAGAIYMVVEGLKVVTDFTLKLAEQVPEALMAVGEGIEKSVNSINELEFDQALLFGATVVAYGSATGAPAAGIGSQLLNLAGGGAPAPAPAVAGAGGAANINVTVELNGEVFANAVKRVDIMESINGVAGAGANGVNNAIQEALGGF